MSVCAASLLAASLLVQRYDSYARQDELAGMLSDVERAEHVMAVWSANMSSYLGACQQDPSCDRTALNDSLESEASRASAALRPHQQAIRDVWVAPWHSSLRSARDAYLDHLGSWLAYLDEVSNDGGVVSSSPLVEEIASSFTVACAALQSVSGSKQYPNRSSNNHARSLAVCAGT